MALCVLAAANCTREPQVVRLSNGSEVSVSTSAKEPGVLKQLDWIELEREGKPFRFVVNPSVAPDFVVYSGLVGAGPPIIVTRVRTETNGRSYSVIEVVGDGGAEVKISSPKDWQSLAGSAAVTELQRYQQDCETIPRSLARAKYGVQAEVSPEGVLVLLSSGVFLNCGEAWHDRAYGLILDIDGAKLLISNIFTKIYLEEISQ